MEKEIKKRKRRTDEQRLLELEEEMKKLKSKIAGKKEKEYVPICNNLGKLLVELSGYDIYALSPEQKAACKKESSTAKKILFDMAKLIVEQAGENDDIEEDGDINEIEENEETISH